MPPHTPEYEIVHNKQAGQWEVRLTGLIDSPQADEVRAKRADSPQADNVKAADEPNEIIGYASYDFYDDAILITRTSVRREYTGMGIAENLIRTALDEIRSEGAYCVVPICSYVQNFIDKHPEYQELLPKKEMEPGLRLGDA